MIEERWGKNRGQLFVISAPSGAGKTSLVKELMKSSGLLEAAISHTTRMKRPGEVDGINYHFTSKNIFREMIGRGDFLEWAVVFEHLYGTSTAAADLVLSRGKNLILEIDWQGAAQVREKISQARSIFILPPSLEALRNRLERRAQDDKKTVNKRMAAAFEEISHWREFDYLIVNDDFDVTLKGLHALLHGKGAKFEKENQLEKLAPLIDNLLPQY